MPSPLTSSPTEEFKLDRFSRSLSFSVGTVDWLVVRLLRPGQKRDGVDVE